MNKSITKILLSTFVLFLFAGFLVSKAKAQNEYQYQLVDKSPSVVLSSGDSVVMWVKVQNSGSAEWTRDNIQLGTYNTPNRTSLFKPMSDTVNGNWSGWTSDNRIIMDKESISPGETGGFGFYVTANNNIPNGTYEECFELVANNTTWMQESQEMSICWDITVTNFIDGTVPIFPVPIVEKNLTYDYEYVQQSPYPSTLEPNEITSVWLEIKNTGTATWYNDQFPIIRIGTGSGYEGDRDYTSSFYDPDTWLSNNRPVTISDSGVIPGETTRFQFNIKAPENPGTYKAYFTPVADGLIWMKDIGLYWELTVEGEEEVMPPVIEPWNADLRATTDMEESIRLNWEHADNRGDVDPYRIYRADAPGGTYELVDSAPHNHYIDYNITPGVYYYYIVGYIQSDGTENGLSDYAEGYALGWNVNLKATDDLTSYIRLNWDNADDRIDTDPYKIYRASSPSGTYEFLDASQYNRYIDYDVAQNTYYYYKVSVIRSDGTESTMSNHVEGYAL